MGAHAEHRESKASASALAAPPLPAAQRKPTRRVTYHARPATDNIEAQGAGVAVQDEGQAFGFFALEEQTRSEFIHTQKTDGRDCPSI